jgi:hypothetical protein
MVDSSVLGDWKETLGLVLTYARGKQTEDLINRLATRLEVLRAAVHCLIFSGFWFSRAAARGNYLLYLLFQYRQSGIFA